jgi:hypothetical protein
MGKTPSQMPEVQGGGQSAKRRRYDGAALGPRSVTRKYGTMCCSVLWKFNHYVAFAVSCDHFVRFLTRSTANATNGQACRLMHDAKGPVVARLVCATLFEHSQLDLDDIPYALNLAASILRDSGVPVMRWALYVHVGDACILYGTRLHVIVILFCFW